MVKKSILPIIFLFLYTLNSHAEGQDGLNKIANIFNLIYNIGILICITCYIIIARVILKSVLNKKTITFFGKKINNTAFRTSVVITFLSAIFLGMIVWLYDSF
ncbi:hypothetical protein ASE21_08515 [Flavobacterium sp. Root901]|nr:hypothetical protein ASE21_08515 [Flavobacterium sp. Root901]